MIHQSDALGVDAGPDPPLRDLVHVLDRLLAAVSDSAQEFRVGVIDRRLQYLAARGRERPVLAHIAGQRSGAQAVDLDAELLERALERGNHGEHADGTGQRGGAREYLIRRRGNIVPAGRGVGAHGDDHGLAGFAQGLHLAQDLLRREHAAARTVHAQHHRLHGIVVTRLAQQIGRALAADGPRRLMAVENLPRGDHDAHLGIRFGFQDMLGAYRGQVLTHPDGIEGVRVLVLAHQHLELVGHLPAALQRRDQAALQRQFGRIAADGGQRGRLVRDELIERAGRQRAGARHVLLVGVP